MQQQQQELGQYNEDGLNQLRAIGVKDDWIVGKP